MKAELASWEGDVFGINLTAENEDEDKALKRLFDKGVKINALTPRKANQASLQVTFADLVGAEDSTPYTIVDSV